MSVLAKPEPVAMMSPEETAITPMNIISIAIAQNADVDKLTKLLELQERWDANQAKKAYDAAMAKFKSNPPQISKNKHVKFGQTEYDHATLDHVCEVITKALSAVGISHTWAVEQNGAISVSCVLTHEMGHSERTTLTAAPDSSGSKNPIQAIGSAVTYLQRYTLLAATGMAAGLDDDAQSAGMPDTAFIEHQERIENSRDVAALQKAFAAAYKAAQDAKDKSAMGEFITAKDARKKELSAGH